MQEDEETHARELAATQSRFRSANDRLRRIVSSYRFEAYDRAPFICECADPACFETVMLSLVDYDRVRAQPTWFLLAAGHEDSEAPQELIVEAESGYAITEMVSVAGEEAARLYRQRKGATR